MPSDFPAREMSTLVQLFQRAHSKVVALQRMDDQIALLVEQHMRLQEEVRTIQRDINEEFERVIRYNQVPAKLAEGMKAPAMPTIPVVGAAVEGEAGENGDAAAEGPAGTMELRVG